MHPISKILLPVDLSHRGVGAARHAAALADHFHAELTVFHVLESSGWIPVSPWEYEGRVEEEAEQSFREQRRQELECFCKDEFAGLNVKHVMATGNPAEEIVRQAETDNSSLIVMGTRGKGPFRRFLIGSITSKVLHDTLTPVWTGVHLEETSHQEWKAIRHVVCAVDQSVEAQHVLKWGADFAAEFGARLTIVRVVSPIVPPGGSHADPDWWKMQAAQALDDVTALKKSASVYSGAIVIEEGHPAEAIAQVAGQQEADLLVIGRSPKHGLLSRLMENAYEIIRESPCPVVSV